MKARYRIICGHVITRLYNGRWESYVRGKGWREYPQDDRLQRLGKHKPAHEVADMTYRG